jgi:hypothetical protein
MKSSTMAGLATGAGVVLVLCVRDVEGEGRGLAVVTTATWVAVGLGRTLAADTGVVTGVGRSERW